MTSAGRRVSDWIPGERLAGRVADDAPAEDAPIIGVLALQGDVFEHLAALRRCGARAERVRAVSDLDGLEGLVIPGGESTTIGKLLVRFGLLEPIRSLVADGLPVFGTCAGMILLSEQLAQDDEQPLVGGLRVITRRNAFGRQVASFDATLEVEGIDGGPLEVSSIRAPWVEEVGEGVEVLATIGDHPVIVRQDNLLASAFHPEVTGDDRLHRYFLEMVAARRGGVE